MARVREFVSHMGYMRYPPRVENTGGYEEMLEYIKSVVGRRLNNREADMIVLLAYK